MNAHDIDCEWSECVDSWLAPATAPSRALRARTLVVPGWITEQGVQAPKTMHPRQAAWYWDCASTDTGRASDSSDRSKTRSHQAPQCTHPNGQVQECAHHPMSDYQSCAGMLQLVTRAIRATESPGFVDLPTHQFGCRWVEYQSKLGIHCVAHAPPIRAHEWPDAFVASRTKESTMDLQQVRHLCAMHSLSRRRSHARQRLLAKLFVSWDEAPVHATEICRWEMMHPRVLERLVKLSSTES